MSRYTEAVARMRGALLVAEMALKAAGEAVHKTADQLAEKVREFRDGDEQDGGRHADDH